VYSGRVAGTGYARLAVDRKVVRRIILLGPAHRVPVRGLATSSHDYFATPLGRVQVDRPAIECVADLPQVTVMDAAHAGEHSLEVHLPFLQCVLDEFSLVPFAVGDASASEVEQVLQRLWGGEETRIVVSSDLSHFHDYATACEIDRATAAAITELQSVSPEEACGAYPIAGLLEIARKRGMVCELLSLMNSGDTAGPRDRVVGYGAFSFTHTDQATGE
jgi:AmmeMemoRadiSam system protein B